MNKNSIIKAKDFDTAFDRGEDISSYIDPDSIKRPDLEQHKVQVSFPAWAIESIDRMAGQIGISRQSLIKDWITERLKQERALQEVK